MPTIRKSAFSLTAAEQNLYISVITQLNTGPTPTAYAQFVAFHRDMNHRMHSGMGAMGQIGKQRFLSWHRDFLLKLEQQMQAINPASFIPYWRWSSNRRVPPWLTGVLPTVVLPAAGDMPAVTVQVTRTAHSPAGLPTAAQVASLDANTGLGYTQFTSILEGFHNTVHGWVGGTMNDITVSPSDPIFWMHHGEIDRIWSAWQANPANAGKAPTLAGADAVMDPWPETATQLRSIGALEYSYA
jgi:tyrosinase